MECEDYYLVQRGTRRRKLILFDKKLKLFPDKKIKILPFLSQFSARSYFIIF